MLTLNSHPLFSLLVPSTRKLTLVPCLLPSPPLRYFKADPNEYQVVFTRSATGALQIVGETFPWSQGSIFAYLRENHNSVLGMREYALDKGGHFQAMNETFVEAWLGNQECKAGTRDVGGVCVGGGEDGEAGGGDRGMGWDGRGTLQAMNETILRLGWGIRSARQVQGIKVGCAWEGGGVRGIGECEAGMRDKGEGAGGGRGRGRTCLFSCKDSSGSKHVCIFILFGAESLCVWIHPMVC